MPLHVCCTSKGFSCLTRATATGKIQILEVCNPEAYALLAAIVVSWGMYFLKH